MGGYHCDGSQGYHCGHGSLPVRWGAIFVLLCSTHHFRGMRVQSQQRWIRRRRCVFFEWGFLCYLHFRRELSKLERRCNLVFSMILAIAQPDPGSNSNSDPDRPKPRPRPRTGPGPNVSLPLALALAMAADPGANPDANPGPDNDTSMKPNWAGGALFVGANSDPDFTDCKVDIAVKTLCSHNRNCKSR